MTITDVCPGCGLSACECIAMEGRFSQPIMSEAAESRLAEILRAPRIHSPGEVYTEMAQEIQRLRSAAPLASTDPTPPDALEIDDLASMSNLFATGAGRMRSETRNEQEREWFSDLADHLRSVALILSRFREHADLVKDRDRLAELVCDVARSGVEYKASNYLTIQIDPETWEACRARVAESERTNTGDK